jgi:hypothetical protein
MLSYMSGNLVQQSINPIDVFQRQLRGLLIDVIQYPYLHMRQSEPSQDKFLTQF